MDKDTIMALVAIGQDEAKLLSQQLGKSIELNISALIMMARVAIHKTDSEDFMRTHVRIIANHMIQLNPEANGYFYEYEPADADERRRKGQIPPNVTFR